MQKSIKILKNSLVYAEVEVDGIVFAMHPSFLEKFIEVAKII